MRVFQGILIASFSVALSSCAAWLFPPFSVESDTVSSGFLDPATVSSLAVRFSDPPSRASLDRAVSVTENGAEMPGRIFVSGDEMTFVPSDGFRPSKDYVLKITTDAESGDGVSLERNYISPFTTKAEAVGPEVISLTPADASVITADPGVLAFVFSEPVDMESFRESFSITPSVSCLYETQDGGVTVNVLLSEALDRGTLYRAELSTTLADRSGNFLREPFTSAFTFDDDTVPPTHSFRFRDGSGAYLDLVENAERAGVPVSTGFRIVFSEAVEISSVQNYLRIVPSATYEVRPDREAGNSADIVFSSGLLWGTRYDITVKEGVADLSGNREIAPSSYSVICDAETDRPVAVLVGWFDAVSSLSELSADSPYADLSLGAAEFPIPGPTSTGLYFAVGASALAGGIPVSSAFGAFSISETNSCADMSIRSLRVVPAGDGSLPAAVRSAISSNPVIAGYPGSVWIVAIDVEVENADELGLVTFKVSGSLADDLGNKLAEPWQTVVNKN